MPHILIVDDEPIQRMVVREVLNRDPARTFMEVESGEEVMDCARRQRPDLIILDIHLLGQDGLETYRQLKANETFKHIPIILLTATYQPESLVHALDPSAILFTKPFDPDDFQVTVHNILDGGDHYRSSAI